MGAAANTAATVPIEPLQDRWKGRPGFSTRAGLISAMKRSQRVGRHDWVCRFKSPVAVRKADSTGKSRC